MRNDKEPNSSIIPENKPILAKFEEPLRKKTKKLTKIPLFCGGTILILLLLVFFIISPSGKSLLSNLDPKSSGKDESEIKTSSLQSILPVETTKIQPVNSISIFRTYTGTIVPKRSSELSFELAGKLTALAFDKGDRVKI